MNAHIQAYTHGYASGCAHVYADPAFLGIPARDTGGVRHPHPTPESGPMPGLAPTPTWHRPPAGAAFHPMRDSHATPQPHDPVGGTCSSHEAIDSAAISPSRRAPGQGLSPDDPATPASHPPARSARLTHRSHSRRWQSCTICHACDQRHSRPHRRRGPASTWRHLVDTRTREVTTGSTAGVERTRRPKSARLCLLHSVQENKMRTSR